MSVVFAREALDETWDEILPLLDAHWKEVAFHRDIPMVPDWDFYERAEADGMIRCYTVRDDSGVLQGYGVYIVNRNPHYAQSLQAHQDFLYLDPSLRGQKVGTNFINWCDAQLRDEGCQLVTQHLKAAHDWGRLLERLGYEKMDIIYVRRLDK